MLVFLDHSLLADLARNSSPLAPSMIAIDLAAEAIRQGTHVICGDISTFDALIQSTDLFSERTRMLLTRARTKSPFRQSLIDGALWHIRIMADVLEPCIQITATGATAVLLPSTAIAKNPTLLHKPKFIPENNNDGHFYEALVYRLIDIDPVLQQKFATVKMNFDLQQGGGDTTGPVYAQAKHGKQHFCLAVVDSDQIHPTSKLGQTALKVIAVDSPPNKPEWNARSLVIEARTIENLFPFNDLIMTATSLDAILGMKAATIVSQHANRQHWPYIPLKKGVRCFDIKEAGTPESIYFRAATGFTECPNRSTSPCSTRASCDTMVIDSLGDGILAEKCRIKPIQVQLDFQRDSSLISRVQGLCFEMISAFCGDIPVLGT